MPAAIAQALADGGLAVRFLTRVPVPAARRAPGPLAVALAWGPLVGAGIGAAGGAVLWGAAALALPPLAGGLLAVAVTIALTGGLHEDGLADSADALGARFDTGRALAIMRDSRVGTYAALALVLSVGLRAAFLAGLSWPAAGTALVAAHAGGRAAIVPALAVRRTRADGLGYLAGRPPAGAIVGALALALGVSWVSLGVWPGAAALGLGLLAAGAVVALARARIGGIAGDVLGAAEQAAEIAVLLAAVAWFGGGGP